MTTAMLPLARCRGTAPRCAAAFFQRQTRCASGWRGRNEDGSDPGVFEPPDVELSMPAREVVLASRPASGAAVTEANFRVQDHDLRAEANSKGRVPAGKVLVRTMWLSVDPFMRCRFNEDTGVDYTAPYEVGAPLSSAGIGCVQLCGSGVTGLSEGDLVIDPFDGWPWRSDAILDASRLTRLPQSLATLIPVEQLLANVGLSGITALHGMRDAGKVAPGDVVVVSGAAGSVGLVAAQLARRAGAALVVGICGSDAKAARLVQEVGVDAAVTYKGKTESMLRADIVETLAESTELGLGTGGAREVSLYFDNVGGAISEAVIPQLGHDARVVICGQISMYNTDETYPPPVSPAAQAIIDERGIHRNRFLVLDYAPQFATSLSELCRLTASGALQTHTTVTNGLERAPAAFVGMMNGANFGKTLVRCDDGPPSVTFYNWLRGLLPGSIRSYLSSTYATPQAFSPSSTSHKE